MSNGSDERVFRRTREIQFHHCDPAGIVFYPNYLVMMNEVLQDWFNSALEIEYSALFLVRRIGIPAVRLECGFVAPSRFGETIGFELRLEQVKNSSMRLRFTVTGPEPHTERLHIDLVVVCIDLDTSRSIPIPDDIRAALHRFDPDVARPVDTAAAG